jgi:4-hydroxy-3-polyprenylbenzoate decarboxylase
MSRDFQSFLKYLEQIGELKHIKVEVDPYLEVGAVTDRVTSQPGGGSALIFDNIKGHTIPVAMNVFGSNTRIAMALSPNNKQISLDDIAARIERLIQEVLPRSNASFFDKLSKLPLLAEVGSWMPKTVNKGSCQEVVWHGKDATLSRLPILTTWPGDGGPFITLGLSHTVFRNGHRNMGLYRLQKHDDYTLGFHVQLHHDGAKACYGYTSSERMPIAVSLGGDPALTYAATAPLPPFISEVLFAGFLRGKGVNMVRCLTNNIEVPADSEIVIEGWINPEEFHQEGPFGDHTGYYSLAANYPIIHVEAITHRVNPIFPATIVGRPPKEDAYIGLATERIFLPILKMILPEIVDVHLPPVGSFHNLIIVSIHKEFPGHAQKVMNAIWGTSQMMFSKIIVVVDHDVKPSDVAEVMFRVSSNVDPRRDLLFTDGPLDVLDHSSDRFAFGSKIGIDATRKNLKLDGFPREWPTDLVFPDKILERVIGRWEEYGL